MNRSQKSLAVGLLVVGLIAFSVIAAKLPGQFDWTDGNYYTLSETSRELVRNLEEPVTIEYFFSRSVEQLPVAIKNYGTLVEDLLRQYVDASNGMVRLKVIDPKPDTEEEEAAIRSGIRGQPTATGQNIFFGLAVTSADQTEVIPVFTPERESYLEYDISQLIYRVRLLEKPVLGVISQLPLFGSSPSPMVPGMPPSPGSDPWLFLSQLETTFEIRELGGETLPDDLAALALIHPGELSPELQYAIDQFLLEGKPVFAAVDPSSYMQRMNRSRQQMMMGGGGHSSDLSGLLEQWGIEYDASKVVGDANLATRISAGGPAVRYPYWLTVREFAGDSPLTAQLDEVWLLEPGAFTLAEGSELTLNPLIRTTENSGTTDAAMLAFQQPQAIAENFESDNRQRTIAGLVTGRFETAFPGGPPDEEAADEETTGEDDTEGEEGESPESEDEDDAAEESGLQEGQGTLLLIADSDWLSDPLSVRRVNFLGSTAVAPLNDNINLALNLLDSLAGNEALLTLRGKGEIRRPFTRIQEMEREAQEAYQREIEAVEAKLAEVRNQLSALRQGQQDNTIVVSPEVMESIADYQAREAELRSELRRIRLALRQEINAEKLKLSIFNVFLLPIVVLAIGLTSFLRRARANAA